VNAEILIGRDCLTKNGEPVQVVEIRRPASGVLRRARYLLLIDPKGLSTSSGSGECDVNDLTPNDPALQGQEFE
jgi:hypothetical protein